jgi:hypothetical protein
MCFLLSLVVDLSMFLYLNFWYLPLLCFPRSYLPVNEKMAWPASLWMGIPIL